MRGAELDDCRRRLRDGVDLGDEPPLSRPGSTNGGQRMRVNVAGAACNGIGNSAVTRLHSKSLGWHQDQAARGDFLSRNRLGRATKIALWGTFARRRRKSPALRNNIEPLDLIHRRVERPPQGNRDVPLDITAALVRWPEAADCAGKSEYMTRMAPATRSLAIRGFRGGWRSARTAVVTLR